MKKKRGVFRKIYFITILMMLFTTALAGIQVMASTNGQESKVHWESNTKDKEIQLSDGVTGDGGKWESPTYTSSDDTTNNTSIETKSMSNAEEYAAIAAGLAGVLALSAAKKSSNESAPTVSEGNGVWVPESDRDAVTKMINKAASKEYYIDANGFVKEVPGAVENLNKSSTYSSVLDRLIKGNNKVVIGVGDGWVSSGKNGLEANAFTGNNSGITIGDNGTPQVVVVSGKDMPESSADMTLAHELTHALRGEEGIKSINTTGGINQDEEAHTIEVENKIRTELGYTVRKDGDTSDSGDGSYGKYSDASEEDWYNKIDRMQGSKKLSGNAYSYSIIGSIVSAVCSAISAVVSSSSSSSGSSSSSSSHSSSSSSSSSHSSSYSNYNSDPVPAPIPVWGSSYNDSIWSSVVGAISSVVSSTVGWVSESKPKRNWDSFWSSATKSLSEGTKNILSEITAAISIYVPKILLGISNSVDKNKIISIESFNNQVLYGKIDYNDYILTANGYVLKDMYSSRWLQNRDGNWCYLNTTTGKLETGWKQDNGKWYYLDESGAMQANTTVDGCYLDASGAWEETSKDEKIPVYSSACGDDTGGGLITAQRESNAEYIYNYLTDKGWSKNSICGLLGNMEAESGLNPASWENKDRTKGDGSGYGLVQWTPANNFLTSVDAKDDAYKVNKMDAKELMDKQLEFIQKQLENGGQWYGTTGYNSPYNMSAEDFTKCDYYSASELAKVWRGSFERPGTNAVEAEERANNAEKWFEVFS